MYQKTVTLDNSDLLLIEWGENLSNMTVKKDGEIIGAFNDKDELKQGRSFLLPDRRLVTVVYTDYGLEVWQNGVELVSGGKSGYVDGFNSAIKGLNWVGGAQLVFAPILFFITPEELRWANSIGLVVAGGILLGLGYWAKKTGNKTPFWIAIGFCVLNILITIASGSASGIIISAILIYYLYRGTKSDAPAPARKPFSDPNAPLDSDL